MEKIDERAKELLDEVEKANLIEQHRNQDYDKHDNQVWFFKYDPKSDPKGNTRADDCQIQETDVVNCEGYIQINDGLTQQQSFTGDLMNILVPEAFCSDCMLLHSTDTLCQYAVLARGLKKPPPPTTIEAPEEVVKMHILHYYEIQDPEVFSRIFKGYEANKTLVSKCNHVIPSKYLYKIGDKFEEIDDKDCVEIQLRIDDYQNILRDMKVQLIPYENVTRILGSQQIEIQNGKGYITI